MPKLNLEKKQKIKENLEAIIISRFGDDFINLDVCSCFVNFESDGVKSLIKSFKLSQCFWDTHQTRKSLIADKGFLNRMFNFVLKSGKISKSLYKDKQTNGIKSGKYALCKDILTAFKLISDIGIKARIKKLELESCSKKCEEYKNEVEDITQHHKDCTGKLFREIKWLRQKYKNKVGEEAPNAPDPDECQVCAKSIYDDNIYKSLQCCNNKLCVECITRIIYTQEGKCPFCRQDMLTELLLSLDSDYNKFTIKS